MMRQRLSARESAGRFRVYAVREEGGIIFGEPMHLSDIPAGVRVLLHHRATDALASAERYGGQQVTPTGPFHLGLAPFALALPEDPKARASVRARIMSRTAVYREAARWSRNAKAIAKAVDSGTLVLEY